MEKFLIIENMKKEYVYIYKHIMECICVCIYIYKYVYKGVCILSHSVV